MTIKNTGGHASSTPKNYSRKISKEGFICTCLCQVTSFEKSNKSKILDHVMVKYEIEPNKDSKYNTDKFGNIKNTWRSYQYWGKFKRVIEIPKIFKKFEDTEYIIKISSFTRDGVQVPFICEIEILNLDKYLLLKNIEARKTKLINLLDQ